MALLLTITHETTLGQNGGQNVSGKWDLRRCVEFAVQNNISVKQEDIQRRIADVQQKQAEMGQYPTLGFNNGNQLGFGRTRDFVTQNIVTQNNFGSNFSVQSSVTLFNWFSTKYQVKSAQVSADAAKTSVEKLKNDISLNVAAGYLQLLMSIEQKKVAEVQAEQTLKQLQNAKRLVEAGSQPELTAAELEAQLARDSAAIVSAEGLVRTNKLNLKALMNLDAAVAFEVEAPPVDRIPVQPIASLQPDLVYDLALLNLPQQKLNDLRIKSLDYQVKSAKGAMMPTIGLNAGVSTQYFSLYRLPSGTKVQYFSQLQENIAQSIGFGINVPIFQGYNLKGNYVRAGLNLENAKLVKEQDNFNLKRDIYQAYTDAITAMESYNAQKKTVETAQKSYDFSSKRFELGLLNTIDLIISQNNLSRAKIDLVAAQFDYVFKMKVLEFYKGMGLTL